MILSLCCPYLCKPTCDEMPRTNTHVHIYAHAYACIYTHICRYTVYATLLKLKAKSLYPVIELFFMQSATVRETE